MRDKHKPLFQGSLDGEASVDGFHFSSCSSAVAKSQMGSANILYSFGPGAPPEVNLKNIIISCSSLFIASCVHDCNAVVGCR